jgi:hypothetical protein
LGYDRKQPVSKEKENFKKVENFLLDNYHVTYRSEVKTRATGEDLMPQFGIALHDNLTITINPPSIHTYPGNPLERMDQLMTEVENETGIKYRYMGGLKPKWDGKNSLHWHISLTPVWQ